ncbi:carbon-nitrogen hydrolase [Polychytrium aggregatum]|uniref:carbon-nitrogen hydrolase n=1 Tax=Polychytrium aggregatum TaxID=110093 RepID=UPI0022FE59DF|nr:carbon-nitrogen hydrolase [Polychytrium aggregatum]XP_052970361.1 carbon-nitrogen hydrolase [Polychytrium aggregatum]KAI9190718.1 carbon-nitrogen hydrolase [Polychytrium aggregatum]KAI9208281.1 carbon-nitrogen hydrolase [Polychytrium aggregatum]
MKVSCLQFDPKHGQPKQNMAKATQMLAHLSEDDKLDVLVLPELGFTGYTFKDREQIRPFAEDGETGETVQWAKAQAIRLKTFVLVGYPRIVVEDGKEKFYNAACFVGPTGELLFTYHRHLLSKNDEGWADQGDGFKYLDVPSLGRVGFGISLDLSTHQLEANRWMCDFTRFQADSGSQLILCPMAWTRTELDEGLEEEDPSFGTVKAWGQRLRPVIDSTREVPDKTVIVVFANRTGGKQENLSFSGTSTVLSITGGMGSIMDAVSLGREQVLYCEL